MYQTDFYLQFLNSLSSLLWYRPYILLYISGLMSDAIFWLLLLLFRHHNNVPGWLVGGCLVKNVKHETQCKYKSSLYRRTTRQGKLLNYLEQQQEQCIMQKNITISIDWVNNGEGGGVLGAFTRTRASVLINLWVEVSQSQKLKQIAVINL